MLSPVLFGAPSTPDIDYKTRYAGSGPAMAEVAPTGLPPVAFLFAPGADLLETSPVGKHDTWHELAPLPPAEIILAQKAALDPSTQATKVYPVKVAALGMIDAGDLVYGHDRPTLTQRVGIVP